MIPQFNLHTHILWGRWRSPRVGVARQVHKVDGKKLRLVNCRDGGAWAPPAQVEHKVQQPNAHPTSVDSGVAHKDHAAEGRDFSKCRQNACRVLHLQMPVCTGVDKQGVQARSVHQRVHTPRQRSSIQRDQPQVRQETPSRRQALQTCSCEVKRAEVRELQCGRGGGGQEGKR